MGSYVKVCQHYYNYIFNDVSKQDTEQQIKQWVHKIEEFILYHYSSGSIYNTKFWKHAEKLYHKTPTKFLDKELKIIKGMSGLDLERSLDNPAEFALWPAFSIKQWHDKVAS